ncbi:hypothetical protein ACP2AV_11370 [Aliiroseovarius sp. PTFE2010]|uniref:hypothetical protein n=1 Tax=Aliiroseovarius sp. PTFE2010 TaxID=3417190 RepID=UPI003CF2714F
MTWGAPFASHAAPPLSGDAFQAHVVGKSFDYFKNGVFYGTETYLTGYNVHWAFAGEECKFGYWRPRNDDICFVYEEYLTPQCWRFQADGAAMTARFVGDDDPADYRAVPRDKPLECEGPLWGS